ncbi:MAG: histidine--tRNA ligase [Desulfurococcales archaeon]|nr:histidine--tRNA ligase [Desulfurococcales archaeon]
MYEGERPKGFRDLTPELMIVRKKVISIIEKVFQSFGFDPIETPAIEYWDTLAGKYGAEAEDRLIWRFQDPLSGRWYALRYDLTVPLARYMKSHQDVPMPFKRYHIAPVWRHEEPQRGRYREFYQCDADIVGSQYPEADAELIELAIKAIDSIGFTEYTFKVNDRRLLSGIFEEEIGLENPIPVYRVIDKLDKIGEEGVRKELQDKMTETTVEKVIKTISLRGKPLEVLREIRVKYGGNKNITEALNHLEEMFNLIEDPRVSVDLSLVRGLDYYTGPIFEVFLEKPRIGAIAGGGRYDNLIGMFLKQSIPATGISLGLERLIDAVIDLGIIKDRRESYTEAYVVYLKPELIKQAWKVASRLRDAGIPTRVDLIRGSPKKQAKRANRLGVKYIVYIGEREVKENRITIYNTLTGERREYTLEEFIGGPAGGG